MILIVLSILVLLFVCSAEQAALRFMPGSLLENIMEEFFFRYMFGASFLLLAVLCFI